jgi:hypothetical protein
LYQQNLINFESERYWFHYLSDSEFREQFFGGDKAREEEVKTVLGFQLQNGTVLDPEQDLSSVQALRRKRQTATLLPPECVNLPAYKNWAEEGKTAPVQNQGPCGEIQTWV